MSWSHYSKVGLALVVLLAAVATPAAAVSVSESTDAETVTVGEQVDVTYTLTDLYDEVDGNWTLQGTTDLAEPTWTVAVYDNQGNRIGENKTVAESNFTQSIGGSTTEVLVRVRGTVERPGEFSYESPQQTTLAAFEQQVGNSVTNISTDTARPETNGSSAARSAIESAASTVDEANGLDADVTEAESDLDSAIDAYDGENFDNAQTLAERAEEKAQSAIDDEESGGSNTMLYVGIAAVVLLLLLGGGYWYLSGDEEYDELG